ncbi:hypothetical protein J6X96_05535 [bacterium]|nr:hypothetical protein [bacterium]
MSKVIYNKQKTASKKSDAGMKACAVLCALAIVSVTYYVGYVNLAKKTTDTGLRIAKIDGEISDLRLQRDLTQSELEQVKAVNYIEKKLAENKIYLRKTRKDRTVILSKPLAIDTDYKEESRLAGKPAEGNAALR